MKKSDTLKNVGKIAGTSALIATPGIIAGTLVGGPLVGAAVGGATALGNVIGSAAYRKAKNIAEDIRNRRNFRKLQEHVLAENGVLYYQPMVPAPMMGSGNMSCGDMSLSRKQKKEIRTHANERISELAHSEVERITNSGWDNKHNIGNLNLLLKQDLKNMSCSKDMSCLSKILGKDFTIGQVVGNALYRTKVGQAIDKGITFVDNVGEGIITRNGNSVRRDFKNLTGFSEESLISLEDKDLENIKWCIDSEPNASKKELLKARYLSMCDTPSREKLEERLDESNKAEAPDCEAPCPPPVTMFSEKPNLGAIAKGRDFGILSVLASAAKPLTKAAKLAGNVSKNTIAKTSALANATKAAESAAKAAETGGALGKVATGIGRFAGKVKSSFTGNVAGKAAENIADKGEKVVEGAAKAAGEAADKTADTLKNAAENAPKIETKLEKLDPNTMNKYELKGVKMAANSKLSAAIGEKIGYENLGRGMKALETSAATQTAESLAKERQKNQQTA